MRLYDTKVNIYSALKRDRFAFIDF